jgi:ATP-dependent helicase/nuclease subunit A
MAMDEATLAQVKAADPAISTWLSANAGSGKTRVLTDRVARLLLSDVRPEHILCLTYTKAAAMEMQNRLFKRLGEWAMKDDAALTHALTDIGVAGLSPEFCRGRGRCLRAPSRRRAG